MYVRLVAILFLSVLTACSQRQKKKESPNIIFILADDLGFGDIGVYGQDIIETPNIDQLASNGILFTQFYAGSPVCAPSRYMYMTGHNPGHAYIRGNKQREGAMNVWNWNFEALLKIPKWKGRLPYLILP